MLSWVLLPCGTTTGWCGGSLRAERPVSHLHLCRTACWCNTWMKHGENSRVGLIECSRYSEQPELRSPFGKALHHPGSMLRCKALALHQSGVNSILHTFTAAGNRLHGKDLVFSQFDLINVKKKKGKTHTYTEILVAVGYVLCIQPFSPESCTML